jgi:Fe-S oxidoreductase
MKNEYPALGADFQVFHYTQILAALADPLPAHGAKKSLRVTFHDPCYLGRHNKDFYSPRTVLGRLDGVEVVEMDRSMNDSLCCGGGGGNFFTDILPGGDPNSPSRARVREAAEASADVLAVACPKCAKMFEDAIKAEGLEDRLRVCDIAELIAGE